METRNHELIDPPLPSFPQTVQVPGIHANDDCRINLELDLCPIGMEVRLIKSSKENKDH